MNLVDQINVLWKLKRMGTLTSYPRPDNAKRYELTVLLFADALKPGDHGQVGVLTELLVGKLEKNAVFRTDFWISHKYKPPVKSVPAAEILASAEAINHDKVVAHT